MFRQAAAFISYALPSLPGFDSPKTYATWPVWRDSTTEKVKFTPLPKKQATKLFHKARHFERQTRKPGQQDGALGRNGLAVLHALIFDHLHYISGKLDPAIKTIARAACISERSVRRGLNKLKSCGVLNWIRRAAETRDEQGRFCLEQDTNAYGIMPVSMWRGFIDRDESPPPHPSTYGATPPLPPLIDQAAEELAAQPSAWRTALGILEADHGDELAAGLARWRRAFEARNPQ